MFLDQPIKSRGAAPCSAPVPPLACAPASGFPESDLVTQIDAAAVRTGILFLAFAIFCFTAMDALAKHMISIYPTIEVIWARNVGQLFFVLVYLGPRLRQAVKTKLPGWHLLRSLTQLSATAFFFVSLNYIGLGEATALADINPVLITLGAALFLGEKLSRARVAGVLVAMVGALIITRPGLGVFSWAALLPLLCAISYAANMLLTRLVGSQESPAAAMFYAAAFGSVATSLVLPFNWKAIPLQDVPMFALLGALGAVAQFFTIRAYSQAQATVLAPFGYLDMVFAIIWSGIAFAAWPDRFTLFGALVIALAGLYVWRQERSGSKNRPAG
jgi:drug/metabolite transporter (DMT)-like permease